MLQIGACKWRVPAATSLPTSYKTVSYNIVILLLDLISWILHSYCTVAQPALMCDLARMLLKCRYQKATPEMSHNWHSSVLPFKQPTFAYVNTEYIAVLPIFTMWRHMLQCGKSVSVCLCQLAEWTIGFCLLTAVCRDTHRTGTGSKQQISGSIPW